MPTFSEDLRTFLLATPGLSDIVGENVAQNRTPQNRGDGIAFRRGTSDPDETRCLSGDVAGPVQFEEYFDVEGLSEDPAVADQIAGLLKTRDGHFGAFGSGTVQSVFVRDQTTQYTPIGAGEDDARHREAVEIQVSGYEPGT